MRCLIVDDNPAFIAAAAEVLERGDGLIVVGTATNSAEALLCLEQLRPDVTLVDVDLGDESGFELAEAIHQRLWPAGEEPAVILISSHSEQDFADMVDASPAVGFLPKARLSVGAIRAVLAPR